MYQSDKQLKAIAELEAIEFAQRRCPNFPKGTVIRGPDPPDFVVVRDGDRIAIEVTYMHDRAQDDGRTRREQESLNSRTIYEAEQIALQRGFDTLHVRVQFDEEVPIGKVGNAAKSLAEFVTTRSSDRDRVWTQPEVPSGFVMIAVGPTPHGRSIWACMQSGPSRILTRKHLDEIIQIKSIGVTSYRDVYAERCLVIASSPWHLSTQLRIPLAAEQWTFASEFDRVYIASLVENRGLEFGKQ